MFKNVIALVVGPDCGNVFVLHSNASTAIKLTVSIQIKHIAHKDYTQKPSDQSSL